MTENDDKTIGKIKESLGFLDSSMEVRKPDLLDLVKLVNETEEKKEQGRNKQFAGFLLAAVLIVIVETLVFSRSAAVFAMVQAAALAFILPALKIWTKKRRGRVYEK